MSIFLILYQQNRAIGLSVWHSLKNAWHLTRKMK